MGEDFLRRRSDRFIRQRDEQFIRQTSPDLFSAFAPETVIQVTGFLHRAVSPGDELWAPAIGATGPIQFFSGAELAVSVEGAVADTLRRTLYQMHVPTIAQVAELEPRYGLVTLRIGVEGD